MDERPDQIIDHIQAQRDQLGRNLDELEDKVRKSTDWRTYYDKNPMIAVGAAIGGGLLLGTMVGGSKRPSSPYRSSSASSSVAKSAPLGLHSASEATSGHHIGSVTAAQRHEVSATFDYIKAALIAFGIAKAKEFLSQAIPGLESHLADAEHQGRQHNPFFSDAWQAAEPQRSDAQTRGSAPREPVPAM